jgi:GNAT superfamily N-acetyltransferase
MIDDDAAHDGANDPSAVEVRPARPDDADALAALLAALGYPTAPADAAARLAALPPSDDGVLLAMAAGVPVGLVGLHRFATIHAPAPVCYITALVTAAAARGQGVGRRLLEAAERWAIARGCSRIVVTSAEHRADAHAFYERCGYPYTGRRFAKAIG